MDVIHKIGRRKTAVARVYVSEGKGISIELIVLFVSIFSANSII